MKSRLSSRGQDLITILKSLLQLNPYFRMTASECLKLKIFDPIRNQHKEKILKDMTETRRAAQSNNE